MLSRIAPVLFLCVPIFVHAFASSHFSIDQYSIGTIGGTYTSEHYTVTTGNVAESPTGPAENPSDSGNSAIRGSKGRSRETAQASSAPPVSASEIVSGSNRESGILPEIRGPKITQANDPEEHAFPEVIEEPLPPRFDQPERRGLMASVISGDVSGAGAALAALYASAFGTFAARMIFFICVLIILFALRRYTDFGRRYLPF